MALLAIFPEAWYDYLDSTTHSKEERFGENLSQASRSLIPGADPYRLRQPARPTIADRLAHGRTGYAHAYAYLHSPIADPSPHGSTSHSYPRTHLAPQYGHGHGPPH